MLGQAEVIECWDEGFKKVPVGSKATLECPASMAYGDVQKPGIPENSDLVFEVELISCDKDELADLDMSQIQAMAAQQQQLVDTTGSEEEASE